MKITYSLVLSITAFATLSSLAVSAPAQAQIQQAREERREARRNADPVSRSSAVTTARGEFSRRIEADIDTEGERAYRSRTVTGPEGQTAGVLGEITRTENGTNTSQVFTDRESDTAGRSLSRSVEDASFTRQREAYTRSGETASASDSFERTEYGATRSSEFETSTGRGGAVDSAIVRTDDGGTFSRTATDVEGNTVASRNTTVTNDEDGLGRTTTVTTADGEEYESSQEIERQ